jgi:hypothetical protein
LRKKAWPLSRQTGIGQYRSTYSKGSKSSTGQLCKRFAGKTYAEVKAATEVGDCTALDADHVGGREPRVL